MDTFLSGGKEVVVVPWEAGICGPNWKQEGLPPLESWGMEPEESKRSIIP